MKINQILLLLFVVCSLTTKAQTTTSFRMNYDQALFDLPGSAVEGLTPNTYVFAGSNLNFIPIFGTITQLDASGNLMWSKRYGDGSIGFQLNDIKKDIINNEYYVCGGSESNAGVFMRLNATGDIVVSTKFSISEADGAYLQRVVKTSDGGYVAVGYVTGYDPDGAGPEIKFNTINYTDNEGDPQSDVISSPLIVKFDANGNHLWHKVTRYYTNAAKDPATHRIYNDASFSDVVEVVDGYIAVGQYDVNQHRSATNSDGDDATPTDALIFKTDFLGNITYHKQIDNPSTSTSQSSKFLSAINKTSTGDPIAAGGTDSGRELIMKYGAAGNFSLTFSRQFTYASSFFGIDPVDVSQIYEVNGGTDLVTMGMYIKPLSFVFSNSLHRVNAAATNNVWAKYYTFNLLSILPRGSQTSDNGHLMLSMTAGGTNYDYHVIKTDPDGATPPECAPVNFTPTAAAGPSTIADPFYNFWSGTPGSPALAVATVVLNPVTAEQCRLVINPCTPPEAATTVTATPDEICAGETVSITATGNGVNVSYHVYTDASGGTDLGVTPLNVSPTNTTTYYIETVSNSDPACVSTTRTPVTVTVNPTPTANASSNSPICIGQTLNLTSNNIIGGSYAWTGPNGFVSSDQNPSISNAQLIHAGTYSLTITENGCPSIASTVDVIISDIPIASASSSSPVCEGETIQLNAVAVLGGTYAWTGPNGFISSDQNPSISNANSSHAGTYSLQVSVGSCTSLVSTVDVVVNSNPTVSASSNSPLCFNDILNLTATGSVSSYSWTGPNGFVSSDQNPTINGVAPVQSGAYIVTVTDGNGCSAQATANVIINGVPTIDNVLVQNVSCFGLNDGQAQAVVSGGLTPYSYDWSPSTETSETATGLSPGTYTLTVSDANTCSAVETITITEPTQIDIQTSSTPENCGQLDGTTSATATGGTGVLTFTWNPGNNVGQNQTNLAAGIYTVTVEDQNGCSTNENIAVNAAGGPSLSIVSVQNLACFGDSDGSIEVAASGGDGNYSFTWNPNVSNTNSATSLISGDYTVTVTDGGGCATSETITLSSPNQLTASISPTDGVCGAAGSAQVVVAGGTGSYSYLWSPGGLQTEQISVFTTGLYSIVVTDGNGCTANASATVTVPTAISITTSSSPENCNLADGSATASATGGTGVLTYTWNPGNIAGQNLSNVVAGTFSITVEDEASCSVTENVTIAPAGGPTLSNQQVTNISCFGQNDGSISVTASGGDGSYTYTWTPSLPNASSISNLSAGTYTLVVTDGSGCGTSESFTITEPTEINITASSTNSTCQLSNGSASVSVTGGSGNYTYLWTPGNNATSSISNVSAGTYTITVNDGACSLSETITITTTQAPQVTLVSSQGVSCFGDSDGSAEVSVSGGTPSYNYAWSPTGGSNATLSNASAGTYTVTVTDANLCATSLQVVITSPTELEVTLSSTNPTCGLTDGAIISNVSGGTSPYSYLWSPGNQTSANLSNLGSGSYALTVTDANGCSASASSTLTVTGGLTVEITPPNATISAGESTVLTASVQGLTSGVTYTWSPVSGLSCTDCASTTASPSVTTTYTVTAETADGCQGSEQVTIIIEEDCGEYFMPTIFSPNGDLNNDELCLLGNCISSMDLKIYNRWGELVFQSSSQSDCWDGTFKGAALNPASFVYVLKLTFSDGSEIEENGNVSLVR